MNTESPQKLSRHSEKDIDVLKKLFGKNLARFNALRNLLYQFKLSEAERSLLDLKPQEYAVLKQFFLPVKIKDAPLWKQTDMWTPLLKIREWSPDISELHILAQNTLIDYIKQQFTELITGTEGTEIIFDELSTKGVGTERFINMLAYQGIGAYIEGFCEDLWNRSNPPKEKTKEEIAEQFAKDSNK